MRLLENILKKTKKQNIVYKTSTAAKVRACAEVEHLAMEIVFSYRFFQKSLAFQAGQ